MKDLVFVVTSTNDEYIGGMLSSVFENNNDLFVLIVFVNQCNFDISPFKKSLMIEMIEIKTGSLSLSKARNTAINYLLENNIKAYFIMFPDDDSSFDVNFFKRFKNKVELGKCYLIDVFCSGSKILYKKLKFEEYKTLSAKHYEAAMSVNMIIDYSIFLLTGLFDEHLGVGAMYGAGEDGDYYIRCCENSKFYYNPNLYNFHPAALTKYQKMTFNQLKSKFTNYGNGVIYMLCKHEKYRDASFVCLKAVGGIFFSLIQCDIKRAVAYFMVVFTRSFFFAKCILNRKSLFN